VGVLPNLAKTLRIGNVVVGDITIGWAIEVIVFPLMTTIFLVTMLGVGLFFLGIARIIQGIANKGVSKWSRGSSVSVVVSSLALL
jgi:uncharacterized membrane protein HdeD (DUF308 family)